jgi:hypothetical protein
MKHEHQPDALEAGQIAEGRRREVRHELDARFGRIAGFGARHHGGLMRRVDAPRVGRAHPRDRPAGEVLAAVVAGRLVHGFFRGLRPANWRPRSEEKQRPVASVIGTHAMRASEQAHPIFCSTALYNRARRAPRQWQGLTGESS